MGTEKFFVFNEAGTLKRLKGRIVRFLDNEEPDNDDKVAIRSSLSVPASAEGLTPANNLSDVSNAATSRTNLSVNSIAEDAEANGTKLLGPSVYFDGTNDVVTVADDAKLSFTDGTDDIPFTTSAWAYIPDPTKTFYIVGKWGTGGPTQEWLFATNTSGQIRVSLGDGTSSFVIASTNTIPQAGWYHFALTYSGSGPNSSNTFDNASSGVKLFINGIESATSGSTTGYTGQSNTSQTVRFGAASNLFSAGSLRSAQIFNRELTASEVADLAKGNELGFSDQFGGALGGVYTQDATPSNDWVAIAGTDADEAGPIGGRSNVLKYTLDTSLTSHLMQRTMLTVGKRYRVSGSYYIPAAQSNIDGVWFLTGGSGIVLQATSPTLGVWNSFTAEVVATDASLRIYGTDGGLTNFQDAAGNDVFYIDGLTVTEIGTLADFRSERFDSSTNKWYDLSDNAFVGTNSGATLVGREVPVYETGTWSGVYTPSTGSFTTMTMDTDLVYTRIGNICTVTGVVQSDDVDATGASGSLRIDGLPFAASKVSVCQVGYAWAWGVNYPISGAISGSSIYLYKRTSSTARTDDIAVTDLTTGSTNNRNVVYISATYKIQ